MASTFNPQPQGISGLLQAASIVEEMVSEWPNDAERLQQAANRIRCRAAYGEDDHSQPKGGDADCPAKTTQTCVPAPSGMPTDGAVGWQPIEAAPQDGEITVHVGSYQMGIRDGVENPDKAKRYLATLRRPLMDESGFADRQRDGLARLKAATAALRTFTPSTGKIEPPGELGTEALATEYARGMEDAAKIVDPYYFAGTALRGPAKAIRAKIKAECGATGVKAQLEAARATIAKLEAENAALNYRWDCRMRLEDVRAACQRDTRERAAGIAERFGHENKSRAERAKRERNGHEYQSWLMAQTLSEQIAAAIRAAIPTETGEKP